MEDLLKDEVLGLTEEFQKILKDQQKQIYGATTIGRLKWMYTLFLNLILCWRDTYKQWPFHQKVVKYYKPLSKEKRLNNKELRREFRRRVFYPTIVWGVWFLKTKQTNTKKETNKQTNKQTNKETNKRNKKTKFIKQTKQTNKQ